MSEILLQYKRPDPTTWVYLSSFLTIGLYFVFHRFWSLRNVDIILLILLAPGLLMVHEGRRRRLVEFEHAGVVAIESEPDADQETQPDKESLAAVPADNGNMVDANGSGATGVSVATSASPGPIAVDVAAEDTVEEPASAVAAAIDKDELMTSVELERFGFVWLLSVQVLILFRLIADPLMVRRPLLDPNLTTGGMLFLGVWLFIFMMANVVTSTPRLQIEQGPQLGPGYSLMNMLPAIPTRPTHEIIPGSDENTAAPARGYVILARVLAIVAHLGIVTGIIGIGFRHFNNPRAGVGCAMLYLLMPYTAQMTGRVDHALPAALLVWAVFCYRRPYIAGFFLGAAAGLVYYPLFLLPLWLSFYWQRGVGRFAGGAATALVIMMALLVVDGSEPLGKHLMRMFGLMMPLMADLQGIWGLGWEPMYRLPILVAFIILSGFLAVWPAQKNLGTLIGCSAAMMVGAQFWHAYGGGLYIAWFLPLLLLTIFRPNLEDRVALKVIDGGRAAVAPDHESPRTQRDQSLMKEASSRYRQSLAAIEAQRERLKVGDARWNLLRVALFLVTVVAFILGYSVEAVAWLALVAWILLFTFLVVVTFHQRLRDELDALRNQRSVIRRLVARLERNWDRLPIWKPGETNPLAASERATSPDAISDDLDVFGKGSLFQFVSMASTGPGLRTLAGWIIGPAIAKEAAQRCQAADALASQRSLREQLYNLAKRASVGTADPDHFLQWITSSSWLSRHRLLAAWSWISPFLAVGLIVLLFTLGERSQVKTAAIALSALVAINALISTFLLGEVHEIFASAVAGRGDVDGYRQLFELSSQLPDSPPMLAQIRHQLVRSDANAVTAMLELKRIAAASAIKQVALLFPVYIVLQMLGLWELHVLRYLERWQQRYREHASGWFSALGDFEAICSLAAIADEYPNWARPTWSDRSSDSLVVAKSLGHPLIGDDVRVCNDVHIGPVGTLLLVTGSNMSGKSTMLRSVGLNVLLAGAGAPVCADSFSLPSLELATSIRVRDNLGEGVSFYMAELHSLARVVKHAERIAERAKTGGETRLLFLLDEILQGTNSRERQIAVAHVLRHLIKCEAIGAITTHDLELADDPQLKAVAHTVHFRETITVLGDGSDTMTFDYKMREGVSPTTNALRLLEVVGLGKPDAV